MKTLIPRKAKLAAVLGFAALAVHATEWKYYAAGAEGNPTEKSVACITDGSNWVLKVAQKWATAIWLSSNCVDAGAGILDLRGLSVDGASYVLNLAPSNDGNGYVFKGCQSITEFYADNVSWFAQSAFESCSALTKVSVSGTFKSLPYNCFAYSSALTNVVVSSPNFTTIGQNALLLGGGPSGGGTCIESLKVMSTNAVTVNSSALNGNTRVTTLTINGPAWTTTTDVDNLLLGVETKDGKTAANAGKNCTIYVDKDKWSSSSFVATLTDYEKACDSKPKKCFGVYREGLRKAWLVANNADPVPFRIIIR